MEKRKSEKLKSRTVSSWHSVKNHFLLLKEYTKIHLSTAMEYKFNFIIQSISMIINDFMWLIFWWIFLTKFNSINSWQMNDMIMLLSVVTFSFGLSGFIFGNKGKIAEIIAEGRLDFYLNLPKNELFHVLVSRSSWFAIGDIIFALLLGLIAFELWQWPIFFFLCTISMITLTAFSIIVGSLGFYWGNAQETARSLNLGMISFASYPITVFKGFARIILFTVIPAGFVSSVPVQLIKSFDLKLALLLIAVALLFLTIAIFVFRNGLKKYESGSMITVRV
jgi:ABC-2 type transport system permease protein